MIRVDIQEAEANLVELLQQVSDGDQVIITRSGKPIARIVSVEAASKRRFGIDAGRYEVPDDFNASLDEDLLAGFETPGLDATL